ncbi:MAG TPA: hypothetical protein VJL89_02860, partial [Thermodesulfovibrionia bacterium]|nr:hypothetical protein [Thermodesulfovibrionia bacterium]
KFSQQEQDRFAHLIMENINKLREFLEEESEERYFENIAVKTLKSEKIQNMFGQVAAKYKNQKSHNVNL